MTRPPPQATGASICSFLPLFTSCTTWGAAVPDAIRIVQALRHALPCGLGLMPHDYNSQPFMHWQLSCDSCNLACIGIITNSLG
jgi:hypothetical protein